MRTRYPFISQRLLHRLHTRRCNLLPLRPALAALVLSLITIAASGASPGMASPSQADAADRPKLSLHRAIDKALASNPATQSSRAGQTVAGGQATQSRAALLPHLSAEIKQSRQRDNLKARGFDLDPPSVSGAPSFPSTITYNRFQADISLKQKLFDYSAWQRYHAAKAGEHAASAHVDAARTDVAKQTARKYVAVLSANEQIAAAKANSTLANDLLSLAQRQNQVGIATGVDVARAKTRQAKAQTNLARAHTQRTRAALKLKRTIGVTLGQPIQLSDRLAYQPVPLTPADGAVERAMTNRSDLQVARDQVKQGRKRLSAAKSRRLPTVSVRGAYGTTGNTPTQNKATTYRVGAQVNVPLFNGGAIAGRVDSAAGQLSQQRIQLRDKQRRVEQTVRVARQTLKTLAAEVRAARTNQRQAKAELKQARSRFENGTRDNIAVVNAQSALAAARRQGVNALADYTRARIKRAAALGLADQFQLNQALINGS